MDSEGAHRGTKKATKAESHSPPLARFGSSGGGIHATAKEARQLGGPVGGPTPKF